MKSCNTDSKVGVGKCYLQKKQQTNQLKIYAKYMQFHKNKKQKILKMLVRKVHDVRRDIIKLGKSTRSLSKDKVET